MGNLNNSLSVLKLLSLYVDELKYEKLLGEKFDDDGTTEFSREITDMGDNKHKVSLTLEIEKENDFSILVKMSGIFEISDDVPDKSQLLQKNTVAIIFPYIRSQITLLTSQPNMNPIVLPTINVLSLLKDE